MTAPAAPQEGPPACVVAVVVTYQPEVSALLAQIQALRPQVARMVVVDNASTADVAGWCRAQAPQVDAVLRMERNLGIGGAQNEGIEWARSQGASHVLLMDQDSVPAADMVAHLLRALHGAPRAGAAGPWHADPRQPVAHSPFVWLEGLRFRRLACTPDAVLVVDHLIASGCLIPLAVLERVGAMRADWSISWMWNGACAPGLRVSTCWASARRAWRTAWAGRPSSSWGAGSWPTRHGAITFRCAMRCCCTGSRSCRRAGRLRPPGGC